MFLLSFHHKVLKSQQLYTVHMALASFVRDGQLPTFTNDLFHCNFHAEQKGKGESRNGMYEFCAD